MTTPCSPNPISMSDVNTELRRPSNQIITLNDQGVRALADIPSGQISMDDLRCKNVVVAEHIELSIREVGGASISPATACSILQINGVDVDFSNLATMSGYGASNININSDGRPLNCSAHDFHYQNPQTNATWTIFFNEEIAIRQIRWRAYYGGNNFMRVGYRGYDTAGVFQSFKIVFDQAFNHSGTPQYREIVATFT